MPDQPSSRLPIDWSEYLIGDAVLELGPTDPNEAMRASLARLPAPDFFSPSRKRPDELPREILSALWLYHGFLDESHTLSQTIHSPTGSLLHGIMHRREGDFGNAKYWFHQVGRHPIYPQLRAEAARIASTAALSPQSKFLVEQSAWEPDRFVDLVRTSVRKQTPDEELSRQIQKREWEILFAYIREQAGY